MRIGATYRINVFAVAETTTLLRRLLPAISEHMIWRTQNVSVAKAIASMPW